MGKVIMKVTYYAEARRRWKYVTAGHLFLTDPVPKYSTAKGSEMYIFLVGNLGSKSNSRRYSTES